MFSKSKKDNVPSKEGIKDESRKHGLRKNSSGSVLNVEENISEDQTSDNHVDSVIHLTPHTYVDPVIAKLKSAKV